MKEWVTFFWRLFQISELSRKSNSSFPIWKFVRLQLDGQILTLNQFGKRKFKSRHLVTLHKRKIEFVGKKETFLMKNFKQKTFWMNKKITTIEGKKIKYCFHYTVGNCTYLYLRNFFFYLQAKTWTCSILCNIFTAFYLCEQKNTFRV